MLRGKEWIDVYLASKSVSLQQISLDGRLLLEALYIVDEDVVELAWLLRFLRLLSLLLLDDQDGILEDVHELEIVLYKLS